MLRNIFLRHTLFALLILSFIIFSACDKKHDDIVFDNPFSPNNPETQGDPFDLRVEARADNSILIRWNTVPNIDGVALYRKASSEANFVNISLSNSGEYIDRDIKPEETYYYQLRAHKWGMVVSTSQTVLVVPNKGSNETVTGKDGAPMVLIPAGEFQMGSDFKEDDAKPIHTVYLDAFYMDVYEVTNNQYAKFMSDIGHKKPTYWDDPIFTLNNRPVVGVSWWDAQAYCKWAGKRLPTEAEWEKAARGGLSMRNYPWEGSISHEYANYSGTGPGDIWDDITAPVGSFPSNGYGLYDMAGNVAEWCSDWYDNGYYAISPKRNPIGPALGTYRVVRGGGWADFGGVLCVSYRSFLNPDTMGSGTGFRCVEDVPK